MLRFGIALLLCFPLALAAAPARGQAPDQLFTATHEQLDVTKVLLAQQDAWNKGDLNAYLARYKDAADTIAILAGPVRGLADIRAAFHINFPKSEAMGNLEQSEVEVRELGPNFALAIGKYHLSRSKKYGGETEGTFTDVFEKTDKGWLVIFSQTS